jgi:hypothetical protein
MGRNNTVRKTKSESYDADMSTMEYIPIWRRFINAPLFGPLLMLIVIPALLIALLGFSFYETLRLTIHSFKGHRVGMKRPGGTFHCFTCEQANGKE